MQEQFCIKVLEKSKEILLEWLSKITEVEPSYLRDSALSLVSLALLKSGRTEDAEKYAEKIMDEKLRDLTLKKINIPSHKQHLMSEDFSNMYDNIAQLLDDDPSEETISRALSLIDKITNPSERDELIRKLVLLHLKKNNVNIAENLLSHIEDPITRGTVTSIVAIYYARNNDMEKGKKLFKNAINTIFSASEVIDLGEKGKFYVRDIKKTLKKIVEIEKIAIRMTQVGLIADTEAIIEKLLEIVSRIEEKDYRLDALRFMLRTASRAKTVINIEKAVAMAQNLAAEIENEYVKAQILKEIGLYLAKTNNTEKADSLIKESINLAKNIKENLQREALLKEIAIDTIKAGFIKIPNTALSLIEDEKNKIDILVELANLYTSRGFQEKAHSTIKTAIDITNNIIQPEWRAKALKKIILALGNMKQCKHIYDLLEKFRETIEQIPNIYSQITIIADTITQIYDTLSK